MGVVTALETSEAGASLRVRAELAGELAAGDSVAVNGVCLTAREVGEDGFAADVVAETLRRSSLGGLSSGDHVNLELPLRAADRLGGHVVLGHVDAVGEINEVRESGEVVVSLDPSLLRYVVEKGSIALDGVSLTVAGVDESTVTVALIPETRERTTFGRAERGGRVNVEVDVLAKHLEKLVAA
jgi:riboflavin synthase